MAIPNVDVAKATTLPVAPVLLPSMVFAATCASLVSATPFVANARVELAPPTNAPIVPVVVNSADGVNEVVATDERALVPLPYISCEAVNVLTPVPPLPTGSVPVMSEVRLMAAVVILPETALRNPESEPMVSWPDTYSLVEVALVVVELVETSVDGVVAPIGELLMVPAVIVRLSATCASEAVPTRSEKLMPRDEVATLTHADPLYERSCPTSGEVSVTPVMSDAKLIAAVPTFPAVALRNPLSEPIVSSFDTARLVEVALVEVAFPCTTKFVEMFTSPTTSSFATVDVDDAPINTWLEVVETRAPEPLK